VKGKGDTGVTLRRVRRSRYKRRWYVVAYDIPATSPAKRRRFYRKIRRYIRDNGQTDVMFLTQSTVMTPSREFAEFILDQLESFDDGDVKACLLKGSLEAVVGDALKERW